jgi:hypothetical protein
MTKRVALKKRPLILDMDVTRCKHKNSISKQIKDQYFKENIIVSYRWRSAMATY